MESIVKGRLKDVDYPYVGNHYQQGRFVNPLTFLLKGSLFLLVKMGMLRGFLGRNGAFPLFSDFQLQLCESVVITQGGHANYEVCLVQKLA